MNFCLFLKPECEILDSRVYANSYIYLTPPHPTSNNHPAMSSMFYTNISLKYGYFIPGKIQVTMNFHVSTQLIS